MLQIFFFNNFFVLEMPPEQRQFLLTLRPLLIKFQQQAQSGDRTGAIMTFRLIHQKLEIMPQYITDPQARQFFIDTYITKTETILIDLENGRGDLNAGVTLLSPLTSLVGRVISGAVGAVGADLTGLVKGLSRGLSLLLKGDIAGAAVYGISDILGGKINAINSILGIFG